MEDHEEDAAGAVAARHATSSSFASDMMELGDLLADDDGGPKEDGGGVGASSFGTETGGQTVSKQYTHHYQIQCRMHYTVSCTCTVVAVVWWNRCRGQRLDKLVL